MCLELCLWDPLPFADVGDQCSKQTLKIAFLFNDEL